IPPLGGLDLSVLIAIIALQFLQLLIQDTFPM
ncbi:MAG: YggT family protein, partial [Pseudomonadota bacterium]|nr:YggT family protein [Pseudomonadota bacterium]